MAQLYVQGLHIVLNMTEQCLNKLFSLLQSSEYVWSKVHRVLDVPQVLNMPWFGIWQGCEYVKVIQGSEYALIRLNML